MIRSKPGGSGRLVPWVSGGSSRKIAASVSDALFRANARDPVSIS
jgi:hypothetical protein